MKRWVVGAYASAPGRRLSCTELEWYILHINSPDTSLDDTPQDTTGTAVFRDWDRIYRADSCEPLKRAARAGELELDAWGHARYPGRAFGALLPEIRSCGVWRAPRRQRWGLDWHVNEGIEFSYLARGRLGYAVDDADGLLNAGDFTISRPWQFHRVGNPLVGASVFHWLILDVQVRRPNQSWRWPDWLMCSPGDLERLTLLLRHNETPVWRGNPEIARCFARLAGALTLTDAEQVAARLKLHTNELLVAVLELLDGQPLTLDATLTSGSRAVQVFLNSLPERLQEDWTLSRMAAICGLGRSQFARHCQALTNLTPLRHLTHLRIEAAAGLLAAEPGLSITEVGERCGFGSSQYFANTFRAHTGHSPREYRRRQTRSHELLSAD